MFGRRRHRDELEARIAEIEAVHEVEIAAAPADRAQADKLSRLENLNGFTELLEAGFRARMARMDNGHG